MTGRTWLLLSWIVIGAAALIAHATLLWQIVRADEERVRWYWRPVAFVMPIIAPVLAWAAGKRASVIVWIVLVLSYLGLRLLESSV